SNAAHPIYRLAGTSLCERYGSELKGTNFLSHWDGQSRNALGALMRQSLETVLAPVSFGDDGPTRFLGMVQVLSDISALGGRAIAFERLVASHVLSEN